MTCMRVHKPARGVAWRGIACRAVNAAGTDFELDVKYDLIKPIGHGAYGVVISAIDHESGTKVRQRREGVVQRHASLARDATHFSYMQSGVLVRVVGFHES